MKVAAAFVLMLALVAASSAAQTAPAQAPIFKSGSALVALNVTVQDGQRFVADLRPDDFAVYEDGVRQQVQFFESDAVPLDLILLVDTSSSMGDKLAIVHDAASGFLKTLRDQDRGAVVTFADSVQVAEPLTSDRAALDRAVRSTGAKGSTSLNNAVYIALKQFGRAAVGGDSVRRQAVVVLSDGEDTSSLVSFDDVVGMARKTGVNIYTVGLQSKYAASVQEQSTKRYFSDADYAMKTLARESGGQAFFPKPTELKTVYGTIATELASQYSIGYVPNNTRADGRFRRVIVQVVTRPALHPRTRQGYTPDATGSGLGPTGRDQ